MPYDNEMYDMLMGDSGDSAQSAKAMSDLLRFKKGAAAVGQQAMGPAQQAQMMATQGAAEEKNLLGGLEKRMQYGQEKQQHTDRMQQAAAESRMNREVMMEDIKGRHKLEQTLAGNNPSRIQQMADGVYQLNQHDGTWSKISDKGTIDVAKAKGGATKTFAPGEVTTLKKAGQMLKDVNSTAATFKDKYAGKGIRGEMPQMIGSILGSSADAVSPGLEEQTNWWGRWRMVYDLLKKHELFGSAFTNTESAAWKAANMIKPGASGETVRGAMGKLQTELQGMLDGHIAGRTAEGYSATAAHDYAQTGKVNVSNGKEQLTIPRADLADAMKDGFQEVK